MVTIKKLSNSNNWDELLKKKEISMMKQPHYPFLARINEIIKETDKKIEKVKVDPDAFDKDKTTKELKDCFAILNGEFNKANIGIMLDLKKVTNT